MIVKKQIVTTQEIETYFTGITLLSKDEYISNIDIIEPTNDWYWWWLRSPGSHQDYAASVSCDGSIYSYYVNFGGGCVRPALIGNLKSSNLLRGDRFFLASFTWTVLTDEIALCDEFVGRTCFRKDYKAKNANDFDASDIKKWLYDWADKNGICFIMQTFSPD